MKTISKLEFDSGINVELKQGSIKVSKSGIELSKVLSEPTINISLEGNSILFKAKKSSKSERKLVNTYIAHIKNLFKGLDKEYVYKLQACNVHFPMTLKQDSGKLIINNFLGEKKPRTVKISSNVHLEIKGQDITLKSHDKELAGQTAAEIEKSTNVRYRDRRVFQDGIFIVEKPGRYD